jgi:hypothetical protein
MRRLQIECDVVDVPQPGNRTSLEILAGSPGQLK